MASIKIKSLKLSKLIALRCGEASGKKGPQNEGITLWFAENKGHKKTTWLKFASTPKCHRKISHLSVLGLNVIERKGCYRTALVEKPWDQPSCGAAERDR